jgi:UDP-2,4-diacetamido-2,4,6-trideoxy-beta-L-altropyranose hydrolase
MRVVCRADASHFLGAGHVMRLLALVGALRDRGGVALFLCRDHPGNLAHLIRDQGFECHLWERTTDNILGSDVARDAEATKVAAYNFGATHVFVDHYGTDATWESEQTLPVFAIEDLFTRPHDCDILLNQNLGATAADYADLVSAQTTCLMGPDYALLRPEFAKLRPAALTRQNAEVVREILINMGGTDQPNATGWVLDILSQMDLDPDLHLTIVMGTMAPHLTTIQVKAATLLCRTTVLVGTSDMGALMLKADFAIGAAGSTSWERCALGLGCIMVILADNQREIANALDQLGAAITLEMGEGVALKNAMGRILRDPGLRSKMASKAAQLTDGQGVRRVVAVLQGNAK